MISFPIIEFVRWAETEQGAHFAERKAERESARIKGESSVSGNSQQAGCGALGLAKVHVRALGVHGQPHPSLGAHGPQITPGAEVRSTDHCCVNACARP